MKKEEEMTHRHLEEVAATETEMSIIIIIMKMIIPTLFSFTYLPDPTMDMDIGDIISN